MHQQLARALVVKSSMDLWLQTVRATLYTWEPPTKPSTWSYIIISLRDDGNRMSDCSLFKYASSRLAPRTDVAGRRSKQAQDLWLPSRGRKQIWPREL